MEIYPSFLSRPGPIKLCISHHFKTPNAFPTGNQHRNSSISSITSHKKTPKDPHQPHLFVGTNAHTWWSCSGLILFWKDIQSSINNVTGLSGVFIPQLTLLDLGSENWPIHFHSILTPILIAARLSITHKWKE